MALFKVYRGDSTILDRVPLKDGYAYFCADSGEFFIDSDFGGNIGVKRVQINANLAKGLTDGATTIEIDDIVLTTDIIDINHGGTGADNAATARSNLNIYSKVEVDNAVATAASVCYTAKLSVNSWTASGDKFIYNYSNTNLIAKVPPVITYTSNLDEYSKIESAEATAGTGIVFTTATKPTADIDIIITDVK